MTDRDAAIIAAYKDGLSIVDIAKECKLSRERIRQILVENNVRGRHHGKIKKQAYEQKIKDAYARITEGISTKEQEAEKLGIEIISMVSAFYKRGLKLGGRHTAQHGTTHYYKKYKCRCDKCKTTMRAYTRTMKEREPPEHGTYSGYSNFGCKCEECRRAGVVRRQEKKRQLMEREI